MYNKFSMSKSTRAEMFNRKAASARSKADEIIKSLDLKPGMRVADIGSGGGYFTLRFAEAVGENGLVHAVDTNEEFLSHIADSAQKKGLKNVKTLVTAENRVPLPQKSLDLIFMRNVYHHLADRVRYLSNLKPLLKAGGRIAIIDHKGEGFLNWHRWFGHFTPKEDIIKDLQEAGYKLVKDHDILPKQHFLIFANIV